jgi:hypothetical protein
VNICTNYVCLRLMQESNQAKLSICTPSLLKSRLFLYKRRLSAPFQPKELRSINQLVVGETADIQAVVVQELSTRSYIGCPNDSKKAPEAIEGKEAVCPKCGQIVKPKSLQWALFLVGDATDEIIASFPPSIMNRPTEGMIIVAQGLLGENEEFLVYRWTLPADTKPGASSSETPLQSFFKPSATATTSSPPVTSAPTTSSPPVTSAPTTSSPPMTSPSTTATPQVTTPTTTPTTTPLSSTTPSTTTALMCDQCSAGPFVNQLALTGHNVTAHAKKTVKRLKKPGVSAYTPVVKQPVASQTTAPTTPAVISTTATTTDSRETTAKLEVTATDKPNQLSPGAVIEPDSRPISLVAGADQAVLSEQTVVSPEQTVVQADQRVVQPTQGASNSVISASQSQSPATTVAQPPVTTVPGTPKEELKAVDGASLASIKYTKLSGLIAKSLQDFKLQFEASFPKDDMAKAIEAAHCTIVDNTVVFVGG